MEVIDPGIVMGMLAEMRVEVLRGRVLIAQLRERIAELEAAQPVPPAGMGPPVAMVMKKEAV